MIDPPGGTSTRARIAAERRSTIVRMLSSDSAGKGEPFAVIDSIESEPAASVDTEIGDAETFVNVARKRMVPSSKIAGPWTQPEPMGAI